MKDSKHVLTSKTIVGVIILLLPTIKSILGIDLSPEEVNTLFLNVNQIFDLGASVLGGIMAIWGRITANKQLSFKTN